MLAGSVVLAEGNDAVAAALHLSMNQPRVLRIFFEEPQHDRWVKFDRYPRAAVRRLLRGTSRPGGHMRVFLNLCHGLERIGVPFRVNDYGAIKRKPEALACVIGKHFVLDKIEWRNPILYGASVHSHPLDDPDLLQRLPVRKILVPGPWMKAMFKPYYGDAVEVWPVGIDTSLWTPAENHEKTFDVLLYNKVMWRYSETESSLIRPIRAWLYKTGLSFREFRYGTYREDDYRLALKQCRAMIFLCEHETQGIAYQQALSSGVPILAWNQGGPWRDPSYYPHRIVFEPVTSIPYWDERCGSKFTGPSDFEEQWQEFWEALNRGRFSPRDYILETLTLEKCAQAYVELARRIEP